MEGVNYDYLDKHKKFRLDSKKLAIIFPVLAIIVAIIVFWWLKLVGITVTGESFCGMDEHTHSAECYISEVVCGLEEFTEIITEESPTKAQSSVQETTEEEITTKETTTKETTTKETTTEETTTEEVTTEETSEESTSEEASLQEEITEDTSAHESTEETSSETVTEQTQSSIEEVTTEETQIVSETTSTKSHTHSEECYEKILVCTVSEHIHTADCFPDKTSDIETVSDWLSTIENVEITNNITENLIGIAMSQIGYEESINNFEYDSSGDKNGYTRYGEWYGNPYGKWNTMFISFCLHYSNINNVDELKSAGAEAMRLAWQNRRIYAPADEYKPERGDIVFIDSDGDKASNVVGIITFADEDALQVVMGDSNNKVEIVNIDITDDIIGYGIISDLYYAKDMTYSAVADDITEESTEVTDESQQITEETTDESQNSSDKFEQVIIESEDILVDIQNATSDNHSEHGSDTGITDLTTAITGYSIKTGNVEIGKDDLVYIGQTYNVSLTFSENDDPDNWLQFSHNDEHYLYYQIPSNIHCDPFTDWHPITAESEIGTVEDVGKYFIDENGYLKVVFNDVEEGVCFGQKYSNVSFTIDFTATIGSAQNGNSTTVDFGNQIKVELELSKEAAVEVQKMMGEYNPQDHTVEYTVRAEATMGFITDFVFEDYTWNSHKILRDTIFVTDLDGNPINPQPTIGDAFTGGNYSDFSLVNFPDFQKGEGYLITYKTKIDDNLLSNDSITLGNGAYGAGVAPNGKTVGSYKELHEPVAFEKMSKSGAQDKLTVDGEIVPVIKWNVLIQKNTTNLEGTVIIDTLGDGLEYYKDEPIVISCYNKNGEHVRDVTLSWDEVDIKENTMSFALPEGYNFNVAYYTTFEKLREEEHEHYTNSVSATINGKYETTGGEADVVGFIPEVNKSASGNDGEYVYYTIEADVPGVIKNWGGFYLTDSANLSNNSPKDYLYVENFPEDLVITAYTKSGRVINFKPFIEGESIENTYILVTAEEDDDPYHTFNIFFNTSTETKASSKWILDEDSKLVISYKIPFDAKTGYNWSGKLTGAELRDKLFEGYTLNNNAVLNYTLEVSDHATSQYQYLTKLIKHSVINDDGTIDYTVTFRNTVPGSNGNQGFLSSVADIIFTDTFDEKLEYVQDSLTVTCYDPWNSQRWLNKYRYYGQVKNNTINASASQLLLESSNPAAEPDWSIQWWLSTLDDYQEYCNNMGGGNHVFSYKLKLKEGYADSTTHSKYELTNTAELIWNNNGTSGPVVKETIYETGLLDKNAEQDGNKLDFDIHINSNALDILENSDTLYIIDDMTANLSVYWDTIKLYYEAGKDNWIDFDESDEYDYTVTYDQANNILTFVVPDELHIRIDYTTLITETGYVSVENNVSINATAERTDVFNATFKVQEHSGGAVGSLNSITLLKQDGDTGERLSDVSFLLYSPVQDINDITPPDGVDRTITVDGKTLTYIGTYTTGADGTQKIESKYLVTGGPYALIETSPPEGYVKLSKPVYFYYRKTDPAGIIQTVTTIIAVENYTYGFELPQTGGIGTLPLAIVGFALMAFPILYSTIRRKRERRLT